MLAHWVALERLHILKPHVVIAMRGLRRPARSHDRPGGATIGPYCKEFATSLYFAEMLMKPAIDGRFVSRKDAFMDGERLHEIADKLRGHGLRPTRQRTSLAELLFAKGDRHVSAEILHDFLLREKLVGSFC